MDDRSKPSSIVCRPSSVVRRLSSVTWHAVAIFLSVLFLVPLASMLVGALRQPGVPLDPFLVLDTRVEFEAKLRHASQLDALAELTAEEWCRALERAPRLGARLLVAHLRVVHAHELQVGRHLDPGERHEADARIVHFAQEQLADLLANLLGDAIRTGSLRHISGGTPPGFG